jgi:hypothetical protein
MRSSSAGVGPCARKRATSSSIAFSTATVSPPGFTVTMICNCDPISKGDTPAMTAVALRSVYTRRL